MNNQTFVQNISLLDEGDYEQLEISIIGLIENTCSAKIGDYSREEEY